MDIDFSHARKLAINRVSAHLTKHGLEHKILPTEIRVPFLRGKNLVILNDLRGKLGRDNLGSESKHQVLQFLLAERIHHPDILVGLIPHGYEGDGKFELATSMRIVFHPLIRKARSKK